MACVLAGLRVADRGVFIMGPGGLVYQTEESATRTEIIGYAADLITGLTPYYTLVLTTTGPNVAIESRDAWNAEHLDRKVWPVIERCVGSKIETVPPL